MEIKDVRAEMVWHSDPLYRYPVRSLSKIKKLILHCDDSYSTYQAINRYDIKPNHISDKGCPGFTYSYFIGKDATIYYCVDHSIVTWHAGNHNGDSLGVCVSYRATNATEPPTAAQMASVTFLLANLCLLLGVDPDNVLGHRELSGTGYSIVNGVKKLRKECPGLLINMDQIRRAVAIKVQETLAEAGLYKGAIDGQFGPKSEAALAVFVGRK